MASSLDMSSDQKKTLWSVIGVVASLAWGAGSSYALIAVAGFTLAAATGVGAGIAVALLLVVGLFTYFSFRRNNGNNTFPSTNDGLSMYEAFGGSTKTVSDGMGSNWQSQIVTQPTVQENEINTPEHNTGTDEAQCKIIDLYNFLKKRHDDLGNLVTQFSSKKPDQVFLKAYIKIIHNSVKDTVKDIAGYSDSEVNEIMVGTPSSDVLLQMFSGLGVNEIFNQAKEQLNSPVCALLKEYTEKTPDQEFYNKYYEIASKEATGHDFKTKQEDLCHLIEETTQTLESNRVMPIGF